MEGKSSKSNKPEMDVRLYSPPNVRTAGQSKLSYTVVFCFKSILSQSFQNRRPDTYFEIKVNVYYSLVLPYAICFENPQVAIGDRARTLHYEAFCMAAHSGVCRRRVSATLTF